MSSEDLIQQIRLEAIQHSVIHGIRYIEAEAHLAHLYFAQVQFPDAELKQYINELDRDLLEFRKRMQSV